MEGPALFLLVWLGLSLTVSLILRRKVRRWWIDPAVFILAGVVTGLGFHAFMEWYVRPRYGELVVRDHGVLIRYWRGVSEEQAEQTTRIAKTYNDPVMTFWSYVWRERDAICIRVTAFDERGQRRQALRPGAPAEIRTKVFPGNEVCVGFQGDPPLVWPGECTSPSLANVCRHSDAAHD